MFKSSSNKETVLDEVKLNEEVNKDDLFVETAVANEGPIMKRMMPRAKGRGNRILKRTTHITVILGAVK